MRILALHYVLVAPDPKLALRIKRARERMNLTQQQLAERIGRNRKTVDNWENARTTPKSSIGALEAVLGSLDAAAEQLDETEQKIRSMTWLSRADQDLLMDRYHESPEYQQRERHRAAG